MDGVKLLKNTAQAAIYNILSQIGSRGLTFILNAFILRYISIDVLGIINVRFFLLYSSILYLSREAFQRATLSNTRDHNWPKVINLLWLAVPASIICSLFLGFVWINWLEMPADDEIRSQYVHTVFVICFCCILEMIGEPLHIVARIHGFNKLRLVLENLAMTFKCVILATTVYFIPKMAIYGHAFGQVVYSLIWVLGIYGYFVRYVKKGKLKSDLENEFPFTSISDFFPRYFDKKELFSSDQLALTWSFFKQGFLKQLLTEGEKFVMTLLGVLSFAEQGLYDVINNLGSLPPRLILRQVEDSSYQFFAGLIKRDKVFREQNQDEIQLVANVLKNLLRVMIILGCLAVCFGFSYSRLLLHLYGGSFLSSGLGPILLRWHCVYILLIAVNGITECFANATMSKDEIERHNYTMAFFSVCFIFFSYYFTGIFGSVGFLMANSVIMFARTIKSTFVIHKSFKESSCKPLDGLIPDLMVVGAMVLSFIITSLSESYYGEVDSFLNILCHVSVGGFCLLFVFIVMYNREKELPQFSQNLLRKKLD